MQDDTPFADDLTDAEIMIEEEPELFNIVEPADIKRYIVRITWGKLRGNIYSELDDNLELDNCYSGNSDGWIDWEGGAYVTDGCINLRATILFEPKQDYIKPRCDELACYKSLEWVSKTKPHFDGVLLKLLHVIKPIENQPDNDVDLPQTLEGLADSTSKAIQSDEDSNFT
ncbi:MAG: hypothetical protein SVZ03_02555 [Spirochaetota bacterium]|nr:hypothetical protein [Spirochaetota bacterium]